MLEIIACILAVFLLLRHTKNKTTGHLIFKASLAIIFFGLLRLPFLYLFSGSFWAVMLDPMVRLGSSLCALAIVYFTSLLISKPKAEQT